MPIKPQPWPDLPYLQNPTLHEQQCQELTYRAYEARFGPPPPPLVRVDIPPRPLPGRQTVPSVDPASIKYPNG